MSSDFSDMEKRFFLLYGRAMEQWQFVELYCYYIFIRVIECHEVFTGSIIYNEIYNFGARLKIITKTLNRLFGEDSDYTERWKAALKNINTAYEYRNELAHFTFIREYDAAKMKEGELSLIKPLTKQTIDFNQRQIEASELTEITDSFRACHHELYGLHDDIRKALSSLRKSQ